MAANPGNTPPSGENQEPYQLQPDDLPPKFDAAHASAQPDKQIPLDISLVGVVRNTAGVTALATISPRLDTSGRIAAIDQALASLPTDAAYANHDITVTLPDGSAQLTETPAAAQDTLHGMAQSELHVEHIWDGVAVASLCITGLATAYQFHRIIRGMGGYRQLGHVITDTFSSKY